MAYPSEEGGVIHLSPAFSSPCVVVAAPLMTKIMTTMTTRCMVSKDCINDKNDNKESKKGKRTFGYVGVRNLEQEIL